MNTENIRHLAGIPSVDEFINYFDEGHRIKDDAPEEFKLISHLTEAYTAGRLITAITAYLKSHPRVIDIKISDINDIIIRFHGESAKDITADLDRLKEKQEKLIEEVERLKNATE